MTSYLAYTKKTVCVNSVDCLYVQFDLNENLNLGNIRSCFVFVCFFNFMLPQSGSVRDGA